MNITFNTESWIKDNVDNWIKENLLNVIPMAIAVINQEFNVVYANKSFEQMFGEWRNRKCYAVYKSRKSMCPECKGVQAFKDGIYRTNEEVGFNKNGRHTRYINHTLPIVTIRLNKLDYPTCS